MIRYQESLSKPLLITIYGRTPSKKNSKTIVCRGKYPMLLSSKKYREWHIDASLQLLTAPKYKIEKASVTLKFFAPDKRVSDLSNKTESVMDLLVDNNVLSDDNWFVCGDIHMIFGGVDVKNPRVEITIQ